MTREWIRVQQLPEGYVYVRDKATQEGSPRLRRSSCGTSRPPVAQFYTEATLVAFVDDETVVVEQLRVAGVPARTLAELGTATEEQLLTLTAAAGG